MITAPVPPRPNGSDAQAVFMRWVWDSIVSLTRVSDVQGVTTHRTTQGTVQIPQATKKTVQGDTTKVPRWG